jgi:flagellin
MPIVVNTNISSINAQRNLSLTERLMGRSMQRLASGLRINRAGDDAAGLAIANSLQAQNRGLSTAVRNANDGLSLIGTAEGALGQASGIMQRIRELAVQAANDVNTDNNRLDIQKEIDQQIQELTRLGNTVEFNGRKLLNGSFQSMQLQVGAYAGQTLQVSLSDFRSETAGQIAHNAGTNSVGALAISGASSGGNSVLISSVNTSTPVAVGSSAGLDTVSATNADFSAIAKAAAINAVSGQTGVKAMVVDTTATGTAAVDAGTVTSMTINGVSVIGSAFTTLANDSDGALRDRINSFTSQTGVVASLDSTNQLVLTAEDGRNITVAGTTGSANITGGGGTTTYGKLDIWANTGFTITDNGGGNGVLGDGGGASAYSLDENKAISKVKVTTHDNATSAIKTMDSALEQLNNEMAFLGAITNRLENTITNIEVNIENLAAAESRIRDADFAMETANLTRAQILQQSGVAVLTQANVRPQAALTLLG